MIKGTFRQYIDNKEHREVATIALILSALASATAAAVNYFGTDKTNRENREYAENLNRTTAERDDNALQRRVRDAQKAGLSPLSAIDTGAAANSTPIMSTAIAPQMDLSSLTGALTTWSEATETNRHNEKTEQQTDKEISERSRQFDQTLEKEYVFHSDDKALNEQKITLETNKLNQDWQIFQDTMKEEKFKTDGLFAQQNCEKLYRQYEKLCDEIGFSPRIKYFDYETEYDQWLEYYTNVFCEDYTLGLDKFYDVEWAGKKPDTFSTAGSNSTSTSAGMNLSGSDAGSGKFGGWDSSHSQSKGIGVNASNSTSASGSVAGDYTRQNSAELLTEMNIDYPMLVYRPKRKE